MDINPILNLLRFQFIRYFIVGIANTLFSYSLFATFLWLGLAYQKASLLALLLGIFFSFMMQGRWVFEDTSAFAFIKFIVTWCMLYGINIFIISRLLDAAVNVYLAGASATLPVTLLSFVFLKLAVFSRGKTPDAASFTR